VARLHIEGLEAIRSGLAANAALAGQLRYQNVNTAILSAILKAIYSRAIADLLSEKL
jgi:hypothetical protein